MLRFGTKAETLALIYDKLEYALVLPQYSFTVREWHDDESSVIAGYDRLTWKDSVIVRSSARSEDTAAESAAGKYTSVLNVSGDDGFRRAVHEVVDSYKKNSSCSDDDDQVLVQPMLSDVSVCGVAFTMDPSTLGHYFVINYDDSGSTDSITSGEIGTSKLYYKFRGIERHDDNAPEWMDSLFAALIELQELFGTEAIDVEFALSHDELYILQVRPLCVNSAPIDIDMQAEALAHIVRKIEGARTKKPFLCGDDTIYSVMTDWNPAEMIGIRPKQLAHSLYRDIITDSIWAYQRDNYGYRNLRSFPLMTDFGGLPYIDVRVCFNSFVPKGLDERLSEKLIDHYIRTLRAHPEKHDKAEFDIVYSCYTFDLPERIKALVDAGFTDDEISQITDALRDITNGIIDYAHGLWRVDRQKIDKLADRYDEIVSSDLDTVSKIYWLLEDCKRYGTLPFAGLARAAFIAVQLLRSCVSVGIMTQDDYEAFMNGLDTVNSNMSADIRSMTKGDFLKKYGHLRPGTYDITSPRYDEAPDVYFDWEGIDRERVSTDRRADFRLSMTQMRALADALEEHRLSNDILDILSFIKAVIEGREYSKFVFTRNLSMALKLIGDYANGLGISRDDCAHLNVRAIYDICASSADPKACLVGWIEKGKRDYAVASSLILPPVITSADDVYAFFYPEAEPNYITSGRAKGRAIFIEDCDDMADLKDAIVFIKSADPGYDWIFTRGICGFATMYGGANSHMAIRAGELGIPAVVGMGEKKFESFRGAEIVEIDAAGRIVRILR